MLNVFLHFLQVCSQTCTCSSYHFYITWRRSQLRIFSTQMIHFVKWSGTKLCWPPKWPRASGSYLAATESRHLHRSAQCRPLMSVGIYTVVRNANKITCFEVKEITRWAVINIRKILDFVVENSEKLSPPLGRADGWVGCGSFWGSWRQCWAGLSQNGYGEHMMA